jgi:hypothetical protein
MKKITMKKPPQTKSRVFWNINPVTRVVKNKKIYSRKKNFQMDF